MEAPLLCDTCVLRSVFRDLPSDHDDPRFDAYLRARFERMSRESRIIFGLHHGMFPYAPAPVPSDTIARLVWRTRVSRETITAIHVRLTHKLALDWPYFKQHGHLPPFVVDRSRPAARQSELNQRLLHEAFATPELTDFDAIAPLLRPYLPVLVFNTLLRVVKEHLTSPTLGEVQDLLLQDDIPLRLIGVKRRAELRRLLVDGVLLRAEEAPQYPEHDEETAQDWRHRVFPMLAPLTYESEHEFRAMIAKDPELRAKLDESVRNQRRQLLGAILVTSDCASDTTSPTTQRVQAMLHTLDTLSITEWERRWLAATPELGQDGGERWAAS